MQFLPAFLFFTENLWEEIQDFFFVRLFSNKVLTTGLHSALWKRISGTIRPLNKRKLALHNSQKSLKTEVVACRAMAFVFVVLERQVSDLKAEKLSLKKLNKELMQ